jgi:hypothetical protein
MGNVGRNCLRLRRNADPALKGLDEQDKTASGREGNSAINATVMTTYVHQLQEVVLTLHSAVVPICSAFFNINVF